MFERALQALRHARTHLGAAWEQIAFQANRVLWHAAELAGVSKVLSTDKERWFCARPFCHFEVKHDGNVYLCDSALVPLPAGNLRRSTPEEVWSSRTARAIRRTILDGSFAFCNKANCRFLRAGQVPRVVGHFCTQAANDRELPRFVDLCKLVGLDRAWLARLLDWGTFTPQVFRTMAVHRPRHSQHEDFLRIMADPALRDPIVDAGNLTGFLPASPCDRGRAAATA
jgi:hypothetical protein